MVFPRVMEVPRGQGFEHVFKARLKFYHLLLHPGLLACFASHAIFCLEFVPRFIQGAENRASNHTDLSRCILGDLNEWG